MTTPTFDRYQIETGEQLVTALVYHREADGAILIDLVQQNAERGTDWHWRSPTAVDWEVEGVTIEPSDAAEYVRLRVNTGTRFRPLSFHLADLPEWLRALIREVK